ACPRRGRQHRRQQYYSHRDQPQRPLRGRPVVLGNGLAPRGHQHDPPGHWQDPDVERTAMHRWHLGHNLGSGNQHIYTCPPFRPPRRGGPLPAPVSPSSPPAPCYKRVATNATPPTPWGPPSPRSLPRRPTSGPSSRTCTTAAGIPPLPPWRTAERSSSAAATG